MMIPRLMRSVSFSLSLGLIVSAIGVWLVARGVDPAQLSRVLSTADYGWVLIGATAIGVTFFARAYRWAVLLHPIRYRGPTLMAALLIGQTLNFLLPLRAGDVARSVALGRAPGSSVERVLGSVAIEKVWDWIALTALVLIVALIVPLPDWFVGPARAFGLAATLLLIGLGLVVTRRQRGLMLIDRLFGWSKIPFRGLSDRWRQFVLERLNRLLDGMESLRRREAAWRAALWSAVTWLSGVAANAAVMRAFGVDSWPAAMFLMAVLMVGVALPPSIAALGIFEALTMLALGVFNVPNETGLAIGLTLHLVVSVPAILAGSFLVVWESRAGRPPVPWAARTQMDPVPHD